MKNKKKMLLVTAIPPFPLDSGGAIRIYNTIKELSKYYDLYLIYFKNNIQESEESSKFLNKHTIEHTPFFISPGKERLSFIKRFQPFWFSDWYSDSLSQFIRPYCKKKNIDVVQIDFTQLLYLINYLPKKVKKIFGAIDISSVSFYRRLKETKDLKKKAFNLFRLIEIYLYEKKYLNKFDIVYSVSEKDKSFLSKIYKLEQNAIVLPNGIEKIEAQKRSNEDTIKIGYIGSFLHSPNKHAVEYFVKEIAPLLEERKIKYEFYLAGRDNQKLFKEILLGSELENKKNLICLNFVKNKKEFYEMISVLVTPLFSGSGTRIKILESLSFGVPVISTSIGAEGIKINSSYLQISNDPSDIVDKIININNSTKSGYKKLKKELKSYFWSNIFEKYYKYLESKI